MSNASMLSEKKPPLVCLEGKIRVCLLIFILVKLYCYYLATPKRKPEMKYLKRLSSFIFTIYH